MPDCILVEKNNDFKAPHLNVKDVFHNLITREEVEDLVKKSVSPDAELVNFQLKPFSEDKIGYLGSHLSLVVEAREPGKIENEVRNFFVKALPYDDSTLASFIQDKGCFHKETSFFKKVVPLMTDNIKGEKWAPQCYLTKDNVMVFEDMKPQGFSNRGRLLDEKSIEAAVGSIARMHASSLIAEDRLQGVSLKALYPDIFEESEFSQESRNLVMQMVGLNFAIDLANEMGLDSSNIRQAGERIYDVTQSSKTKRNVISHGDLWSSNLIFHEDNHCRLVDFQMVRYLPPGHDLMLLLYYAAATEVRQKHEERFIKHYYQVFTDTLKLNSFQGQVPSFEELLQGIEELRLPALYTAVQFHSIVLLDTQMATEIMGNPVTREAFYFGDRKSFVKKYMVKNPEYKKKIEDDIREFVEMSLRIDSIPRLT